MINQPESQPVGDQNTNQNLTPSAGAQDHIQESAIHELDFGSVSDVGDTTAFMAAENNVIPSEMGLQDLEFIEAEKNMASEPISLPAALCDDLLLEEINSIPDKMGFKIGDVADLLSIKQYVLRYWESEFDILKPRKASNNQRMYTKKDVENAFLIRKLLHRDRFSIEGARNAMKELKAHVKKEKDYSTAVHKLDNFQERIEDLARDIRSLRQIFKS